MNIVLLGYMASGKSFIGKKLAKTLKYDCIDLDDFIESQEKCSVKDLFGQKGELYFRKKENLHLKTLLKNKQKTIISLGGGTPCYYDNMTLLTEDENVKTIYLKVAIPELVRRLKSEKSQRPLVAHIETDELLTEFIGKHLFERSSFYNEAEFVIDANADVSEIIEDILLKLF